MDIVCVFVLLKNDKKLCWWDCLFLLLQLAGGVILGVALWLRHDPKTSNLMGLEFDGAHVPNTFHISMYHRLFPPSLLNFASSFSLQVWLVFYQCWRIRALTCRTASRLLWIINGGKCFNWGVRLHKLGLACHYCIALTQLMLYPTAGPHWVRWVVINACFFLFWMDVNNW